jgi:hypothetical protein
MRRLFALSLSLIILFPTLWRFGIVADYLVRYDHYSKELCENQDKPEMSCNGKCKLGKNMISAEKSELPVKPQLPNQKHLDLLGVSHEIHAFGLTDIQPINCLNYEYSCDLETGFSRQVFQPPTTLI